PGRWSACTKAIAAPRIHSAPQVHPGRTGLELAPASPGNEAAMRAMVPVVSRRFGRTAASGALALALVAGFSPVGPAGSPHAGVPAAAAASALTPAQQLARLTLYQRIGKVLMMGVP